MLNIVPVGINRSSRIVVLKHPNAMDCAVLRQTVTRQASGVGAGAGSLMGGLPTLGGAGVLSSGDEAEVSYDYATKSHLTSLGKVLFCGVYSPHDHADADLSSNGDFLEAAPLVEALIESLGAGDFTATSNDLIVINVGGGILLTYEVKRPSGTLNVAPYTRKYILQARDDLDHIPLIATSTHSPIV
jgi:hypothetical protein